MKNAYVLEWSQKTNNFHIQPLDSLLAQNQEAFISNRPLSDYVVLMVGSKDAIHDMADHWRHRMENRAKPDKPLL
jgi:hypothetical protein